MLAAAVLTCVGAVFNVLVGSGSTFTLVIAAIPLGFAVLGVLAGFNWMLNTFGGDSPPYQVGSVTAKRQAVEIAGNSKGNDSATNRWKWWKPERWHAARTGTR